MFGAAQAGLLAQVAEKANEGYQTKEARERVACGLESPDREQRQKPRELLRAIGIKADDVVADVGTGTGFMLPYLVEVVGPSGFVFAEEIQKDFLTLVKEKIRKKGWTNVKAALGSEKDVMLPPGKADWAFVLDVYHHFNYPAEVLATVRSALKPDGRLAVVDFYRSREHPTMSPEWLRGHIRLDKEGFVEEIESAGFRLERAFDHLPHQYVLIFQRK
jgi:ubiquinone/menaquinone biosynthesis C-methylase UbiE